MTQPLLSQLIALSPEQRRAVLARVRQRSAGGTGISRLDRLARDGALLSASFGQDRLWFLWRLAPGSATYHVSWCYEVAGPLDVQRLAAAVDALVLRHEVLRTTLDEQDGQIVQRVGPPWQCGLVAVPATGEQAAESAAAAARELFDLSAGPMLRVRAWQLAPDRHVVAFTAHHVIMDGWSLDIFERELWALYQAGPDPAGPGPGGAGLGALDIQYADYAAWHRDLIAGLAEDDLAWWRKALDGATPVCPAPDHPAPEHTGFSGDVAVVTVPASELDWLAAARAAAGTDFVALFAIWCLFLARHTGRRDLTVGTLVSGRSHPDTAGLIGFFVNTLALRVRVDPGADFPGYLRQVRATVLDAFAHQEVPFDQVVRAVAPRRTAARNPLFTTMFSYQSAEEADWQSRTLPDGLRLTALPVTGGGSHFDLSLTAARTPGGLSLRLEYSTDLYDPATIDGYLDSLASLLAAISHDPAAPMHALLRGGQPAADGRNGSGGSAAEEAADDGAGMSADTEYVAPETAAEQQIAQIWASLLSLDLAEIGTSDDFFAVGGHSLLAIRLAMQLSTELHMDFPLQQIFTTPTITGQAAYADEFGGQPAVRPIPALPDSRDGALLSASFGQDRLWFLWRLAPGSATYHVSWCYEVAGPLDVQRLAAAVDALVLRHEVLRTTLDEQDGQIVQRVGPPWQCGLVAVPATGEQAAESAAAAARELFDLSAGPMLRVRAWQLAPDRHVVAFTAHHVIMDGWSLDIFERELWALYQAGPDPAGPGPGGAGPAGAGLGALDIQYADYAAWHRDLIAGLAEDDLAWWRKALDGATPVCPAPDHPAPEHTGFSGDVAVVTVPASELDWLAAARAAAGTDFVALFAIWCLFLARHTGRRDLTVGTLVSGRSHPDTAGLIGFFVNTLALRVRVDPGADFPGYLRQVRATVLDAFAHQEVPFDQVVRAVAPRRTAARNPLFTTMFSYVTETEEDTSTRALPGGLTLTPLPVGDAGSHFDLSLTAIRTPGGLNLRLEYSTDLYDRVTIDGFVDSLTALLAGLAARPAAPLWAFLEPSPGEQRLLASWDDAAVVPVPAVPLHELIGAQAAAAPDVVAVEADDRCLTYRQLDTAAAGLARRLRRAGVRDGDVVGVHLRPGAVALTAILAAWKAGAVFLPLDPDLPPARITAIVGDAGPVLLVTDAPSPCPGLDFPLTPPPGQDENQDEGEGEGGLPAVGPDYLAYLMYTSGSTGQPKAVMIQHRGLSNHAVGQLLPRTGAEPKRVAAGTSAFISDFFISHIAALAGGHTLVMLTREQRQDPRYLVAMAADPARAVTALDLTTSQLQLLVEAGLLDAPYPPRVAAFGGEPCPPDLWAVLRAHPATTAVNTYGPAETTVDATLAAVADSPVPLIGWPYGNVRVCLLDDRQRPVPPGTPGELCIAGPGVGPGYLGRPAQTAAAFIPDPGGPPGTRLYRTGDLARFTAAGLEYLGRNDYQIKILGQRIEPEEVEAALRAHPAISAAAVTSYAAPGGLQLAAHIIPAPGASPDPGQIRGWLASRLPAAAVPAVIHLTASLPLALSGKLDRGALAAIAGPGTAGPATSPAPATPGERQIAGIWAGLLGLDPAGVGIHDDFFALGGHSILAARLALRISADLGADIPLHQIFTHPTIAGQAAWIDEHAGMAPVAAIPRLARAEGTAIPASFAQERLWFLWQLAPQSPTYHVSWCYQVGGLDVTALAAAVDAMIGRHEILRTTLHEQDGQLVQRVEVPWRCGLVAVPATGERAAESAAESARELFDLSAGPLLRVRAWQTGPADHLLLFTAHHAIIDEWSLDVFEDELWALYATRGDATAAGLADPAIQYADYAAWHRGLVADLADADLAWWREALDGAAPVCPAPDHPAPDRTGFSGGQAAATVGSGVEGWLTAQRTAAATTDFVVLLAVWCLFLARHTGRRDLTVGTPISGRTHPDTAGLIGFLVNTLALRVRVDPGADFPALVAHVRQVVLDAFAHQEIPFDQVVRAAAPQRTAARNPLFTTSFAHDPATSLPARALPGGLTLTPVPAGDDGSHFDLSLTTAHTPGGLALLLAYSTDLYDRVTIDGFVDSLTALLAGLAARPAAPLWAFLEPSPGEQRLLASWDDAAVVPVPAVPLHELIGAQAAAAPDVVAVEADDRCLTYRQLDTAAAGLARRLRRAGVRDGDVVGVHLRPGAVALTAILAAWKAGAVFLPLDPDLPPARITAIVGDAGPVLLVTDAPSPCPGLDFPLTPPPGQDENQGEGEGEGGLPAVGPDYLAYLMYTSGSTGQPKAVMIQHRGLSNHAAAQVLPRTGPAGGERMRVATGTSAFISDFLIAQIAALAGGHTLVMLTREQRQDPRYLVAMAADPARAVTALDLTTSQLQLLVEAGLLDAPYPPRVAAFGGEPCPPDLWAVLRAHPATTAVNTYGPAETTVDATLAAVADSPVPLIGWPYGNVRVCLLDDRQRPVPPGTPGELCIAGPGVGPGYLGRPAQTAAAFIPDPGGPPGTRLYRTGDLARFTAAGLEYLGRNDYQIKILGQRIEPEEVEAALRAHPAISAAAVTSYAAPGGLQLAAHIIPAPGASPDPGQIRGWLASRLPAAAVPAVIHLTASLPLALSGKLDRGALAAIAGPGTAGPATSPAPATPGERQIAGIWAGLLGLDPAGVGIHDDFFALGGHSILAARLALRISADLGADIPLHQIFTHPTIAGQAAWIDEHAGMAPVAAIPRLARAEGTAIPASFAQERLWFLWQLAPQSPTYHVSWCYQVGGLDVTALAAAVDAMIGRHEILRTTLHEQDGQLVQRVEVPWRCALSAAVAVPAVAAAEAAAAADELFDLSAGPLLRVRAWQTGPADHLLLFTAHHVVIDEWSLDVFENELWALYQAGGDPAAAELSALDIQYADYAAWHRGLVAGLADADLAWWREALDGAAPVCPAPDHPAPDRTSFSGDQAVATAPGSALDWLTAVRTAAGTTDFVVMLAVWCLFLARHTGRRDLTVGTPISGRTHPDTAGLIGFFINTLALRVRVDPSADFPALVAHVRQVVLDAFAHQEIPFDQVVRAAAPQRAAARNPLFTTSFAHDPATSQPTRDLPGGLTLTPVPAGDGGSHFDLSLTTARTSEGLGLFLQYSTDLYDPATITGYLESLTGLLAGLAARPATPLRVLLEPSPRERRLLTSWNDAASAPESAAALPELIGAQAAAAPDVLAVEASDICLTYGELDMAAGGLARRLRRAGVRDGDVVGVHLAPGAAAVTAVLAAWKAGAAFLPLDPDLPPARITAIVGDARPVLLVTDGPSPCPWLDFPLTPPPGEDEDEDQDQDGLPAVGPEHLACLMYTSGSAGQPKAVMIQHRGLSHYATAQVLPRLGPERLRMATGTSAFISDFFIAQIAALAGGHTLVVLTREQRQDPRYLVAMAADPGRAVGALECTTSQLQLLVEAGLLDAPYPPRVAVFGGEPCPPDLWAVLRAHPATTAINAYGPAETTVEATIFNVADGPVPLIGRPYGNVRVWLLDEEQRPVPPGVPGELCIAGPGVGPGYLGRPAQTAAVFIPDPGGPPGSRLYRTGDLARFTAGGLLEYLGRNDYQMKILGQRIEPEEVEAALRAHPGISAAAVTSYAAPGGLQLAAHIIPVPGAALDAAEVRGWLGSRLPAAAVPAVIQLAASLPYTAGGKLDRKALAAVARPAVAAAASAPAVIPTERQIAGIWAALLGVDTALLGVHDDFFALGGHSILAARLALRISADLGADIPLHQIFTNPTIAGLATWIHEHAGIAADNIIVPMGGSPDLPPLILVHPLGGTLFQYQELAASLSSSYQVLGVHGDLLGGSRAANLTDRVADYARNVATVLGGRRPVIAGWSAGGVIAHELAIQLADSGIMAERLILIDTSPAADDDAADAAVLDRLRPLVLEHGPRPLLASPGADRFFASLGVSPASFAEADAGTAIALMDFWRDMLTSLAQHQPNRFEGPAHLILSADHDEPSSQFIIDAWQELTGLLRVTRSDADHFHLLTQPGIPAVAEVFRRSALEEV